MDLSKTAKTRRDSVEAALWTSEGLLDDLEECRIRINAAMAVWPETQSTLKPALKKQDAILKQFSKLKKELEDLWQQGHKKKWKE
jgi:hypothetical protein